MKQSVIIHVSRAFGTTHRTAKVSLRASGCLITDCLTLVFTIAFLPVSFVLATLITRRVSMAVLVLSAFGIWLVMDSLLRHSLRLHR